MNESERRGREKESKNDKYEKPRQRIRAERARGERDGKSERETEKRRKETTERTEGWTNEHNLIFSW